MIDMDEKQIIIHKYRVEHKSLRKIASEVHMSRKTITKWIREYEAIARLQSQEELCNYLAQKPVRKLRVNPATALTAEVCQKIDGYLKENTHRRMTGFKKQCYNNQGIHKELEEQGYKISYSSVCKYIQSKQKAKKDKSKEAFIKQDYEPGMECEFDWGEVKLRIRGKLVVFNMAVFAFPYSEGRRAYLFRHQNNLAFMESHRNFFRDIHGVPHTMVYDNMKVAVILDKEHKKEGKKATEALQRMSNYYGFDYRFCNARAGWEKGSVERSVDYVRKQAFTSRLDFDSIEEAQTWLDTVCQQLNQSVAKTIAENRTILINQELAHLLPYTGEFGCYELLTYTVDKLSTIYVKNVHYSVPDHLVGKTVYVQLYSEKIKISDSEHQCVATHERSYQSNEWVMDITHYINTLTKKPGALKGSTALHCLPKAIQDLFRVHFQENGKDFLLLLQYAKEHNYTYDDILLAVKAIRDRGARHLTYDQIKVALEMKDAQPITYTDAQQTDQFIEIDLGAEDVLSQCESLMDKGQSQVQCIHNNQEGGAL